MPVRADPLGRQPGDHPSAAGHVEHALARGRGRERHDPWCPRREDRRDELPFVDLRGVARDLPLLTAQAASTDATKRSLRQQSSRAHLPERRAFPHHEAVSGPAATNVVKRIRRTGRLAWSLCALAMALRSRPGDRAGSWRALLPTLSATTVKGLRPGSGRWPTLRHLVGEVHQEPGLNEQVDPAATRRRP